MPNTLQLILDTQEDFQSRFGFDRSMDLEEKIALIHTHSMFLIEETYEMLRELPFHKPWKDYSGMSEQELNERLSKAREEYIDLIHFVANVGIFLGLNESQIQEMYLEKNGLNIKRQEDPELGYVRA